jgi:hypothetical protein
VPRHHLDRKFLGNQFPGEMMTCQHLGATQNGCGNQTGSLCLFGPWILFTQECPHWSTTLTFLLARPLQRHQLCEGEPAS